MSFCLTIQRRRPGAVAPPPERLALRSCIGCGAIECLSDCTGECQEVRLELVPAVAHDRLVADGERARHVLAAVTPLVSRIAAADVTPCDLQGAYRALQLDARAVLRELGADPSPQPAPVEPITAWWCAGCGRIEAPQPCVGVCIRRPAEAVRADTHVRAAAEAECARQQARACLAVVRQAAWATPRPGHWESSWGALLGAARAALHEEEVGDGP